MNRLETKKKASSNKTNYQWQDLIPTPPASSLGAALAERPKRQSLDSHFATFLPTNYESGYAYPLIVWLHDATASERQLPQVMRHLSTQNFLAAAPRGTQESEVGYSGFDWPQTSTAAGDADEAVTEAVEYMQDRFSVNQQRVFLVGHGEGGSMAMRLAMQSPERFAGVVSLNGGLPQGGRPLRSIKRLRSLPFLLASSREYSYYPESQVCSDLRLLHAAGCGVALRQYPGSDDLTTNMLADVNRWIMDRVCGG